VTRLTGVTITGADDDVEPEKLAELSEMFPFVEWGILWSSKRSGHARRYPSRAWLDMACLKKCRLALHLCGRVARDVLSGPVHHMPLGMDMTRFARVQLNGYQAPADFGFIEFARLRTTQWILQVPEMDRFRSAEVDVALLGGRPKASILFDPSGGKGLTFMDHREGIPGSLSGQGMGFAGGIGPTNVVQAVMECDRFGEPFWIDMESGVRTNDEFDLALVRVVLEKCKGLVRLGGGSAA
jgi:hypothetical protein